MDEISKRDFLKKFGEEFSGDDKNGYDYKGFFIKEEQVREITKGIADNLEEIGGIVEKRDENEDEFTELNNLIMAYIFGDGDDFQGSYEEEIGSGDYDWYLDFGQIEIDRKNNGFNYTGVRFYKG